MADINTISKILKTTTKILLDELKPKVKPKETTGSLQIATKSREKFISYSGE